MGAPYPSRSQRLRGATSGDTTGDDSRLLRGYTDVIKSDVIMSDVIMSDVIMSDVIMSAMIQELNIETKNSVEKDTTNYYIIIYYINTSISVREKFTQNNANKKYASKGWESLRAL